MTKYVNLMEAIRTIKYLKLKLLVASDYLSRHPFIDRCRTTIAPISHITTTAHHRRRACAKMLVRDSSCLSHHGRLQHSYTFFLCSVSSVVGKVIKREGKEKPRWGLNLKVLIQLWQISKIKK